MLSGVGVSVEAKLDLVCCPKRSRKMAVVVNTGAPGTWVPGVHASCSHNEYAALALRAFTPLPNPLDAPLGMPVVNLFRDVARLSRRYGGVKWSDLETALSYQGSLRRRYLEAERSLRVSGPLVNSDTFLRAFLKAEKLKPTGVARPRLIFPRSPRYNLRLASWLKPFEHWLWGYLTARRLFGGSNTRVVAKGLSPRARANLVVRKFNQFRDCVVVEVDGKAFEAHVNREQVGREHDVYLAAYGGDKDLARVLSCQLTLTGRTVGGVKFTRPGCRASGDFNTGMGNTLIMLVVVVAVLKQIVGVEHDLLVDGDNALVFLPKCYLDLVSRDFADLCLRYSGHEVTLEKPVSVLEQIRFGQSAPIRLGHGLGWTMVREPAKVLSGMGASHIHLQSAKFGARWLHGVARCELSLARGVPVLQAAALKLLTTTDSRRQVSSDTYRDYFVVGGWLAQEKDAIPVSQEARSSYYLAFGVTPDEQMLVERSFRGFSGWYREVDEYPTSGSWFHARPGSYDTYWDSAI